MVPSHREKDESWSSGSGSPMLIILIRRQPRSLFFVFGIFLLSLALDWITLLAIVDFQTVHVQLT